MPRATQSTATTDGPLAVLCCEAAGDHLEVPAIAVLNHAEPLAAARMVRLQRASYAVEADLIGFRELPPLLETETEVAQLDLTVLGALDVDTLLGILGYQRHGDIVDIDRLAVEPTAFRRGVAQSLIEHLHTREADARRFEVSTGVDNEPAIVLYQKMGYRPERDRTISGLRIRHLARR